MPLEVPSQHIIWPLVNHTQIRSYYLSCSYTKSFQRQTIDIALGAHQGESCNAKLIIMKWVLTNTTKVSRILLAHVILQRQKEPEQDTL